MYRLCWEKKSSWNQTGGYTECVVFNSIEEIINTMKSCYYRGEWVEDMKGNRIDINLMSIAAKEEY